MMKNNKPVKWSRKQFESATKEVADACGVDAKGGATTIGVGPEDAHWWGVTFTSCEWVPHKNMFVLMSTDGYTIQRTSITTERLDDEAYDGAIKSAIGQLTSQPAYLGDSELDKAMEQEFAGSCISQAYPSVCYKDDARTLFLCKYWDYGTFLNRYGFTRFVDLTLGKNGNKATSESKVYGIQDLREAKDSLSLLEMVARCLYRSLPAVARWYTWISTDGYWDVAEPVGNPWWNEFQAWVDCAKRLDDKGDWSRLSDEPLSISAMIESFLRHLSRGTDWEIGACGGAEPPVTIAMPSKDEVIDFLNTEQGQRIDIETTSRLLLESE